MKKRILIVITILVLIAACTLGIVKRQTYTDIMREKNYMDKLQVAEIPGDLAVEVCEDMKKNLQKLPIILKVRFINDVEFLFGTSRQKICVQKVYAGDGIEPGDEFYISAGWSIIVEEDLKTAELGFVNTPKLNCDYLVFISEKIDALDKTVSVYKICDQYPIIPLFCYENTSNIVLPVSEENTYVPYSKVKNNEFFTTSEAGLKAWSELKNEMIHIYPYHDK